MIELVKGLVEPAIGHPEVELARVAVGGGGGPGREGRSSLARVHPAVKSAITASAIRSWTYCRSRIASRYLIKQRSTAQANRVTRRARASASARSNRRGQRDRRGTRHAGQPDAAEAPERGDEPARSLQPLEGLLEALADVAHPDQRE